MPPNAPNNGRVTNAILSTKLDVVIVNQDKMIQRGQVQDGRITALEIEQGKLGERLKFRTWAHGLAEIFATGLSIIGLAKP